jgi:hypothetical protein
MDRAAISLPWGSGGTKLGQGFTGPRALRDARWLGWAAVLQLVGRLQVAFNGFCLLAGWRTGQAADGR